MHERKFCSLLFVFVFISLVDAYSFLNNYPVSISPESDIPLYPGDSLYVECALNTSNEQAKGRSWLDLAVVIEKDGQNFPIGLKQKLNETAIKVYINNSLSDNENYIACILNTPKQEWRVDLKVHVGGLPLPVKNFTCVSMDLEALTCSWIKPNNTLSATKYQVEFFAKGRNLYVEPNDPRTINCTLPLDMADNCTVDPKDYQTVKAYKEYVFRVKGINMRGTRVFNYTIDHFASVMCSPPSNLTQVNRTTNSILLSYEVTHKKLFVGRNKLDVFIEVTNPYDAPSWTQYNMTISDQAKYYSRLDNLPYPGTIYDVRIRLRRPGSQYLSLSKTVTGLFSTLSDRPAAPPLTAPGAYITTIKSETNNSINYEIKLYWKMLDPWKKNTNGDIEYEVKCYRRNTRTNRSTICSDLRKREDKFLMPYATFNVPYPSLEDLAVDEFEFSIFSRNENGTSTNSSTLYVPQYGAVKTPNNVLKTLHAPRIFDVSWEDVSAEFYTVFYCAEQMETLSFCNGLFFWQIVPSSVLHLNITADNSINDTYGVFYAGVSAHRGNKSSGIKWAQMCSVSENSREVKIKKVIATLGARDGIVEWIVDCYIPSIYGFNISYCFGRREENTPFSCEGTRHSDTVIGSQNKYNLTNLKPYKTYQISVAIMYKVNNKHTVGEFLAVEKHTTEDAPEPPVNFTVLEVTTHNATLSWNEAIEDDINGKFIKYTLRWSPDNFASWKDEDFENISFTQYTLTNLKSATNYSFALKIVNNHNSSEAALAYARTAVTRPGSQKPRASVVNSTFVSITWDEPEDLDSTSCFYELGLVTLKDNYEVIKTVPCERMGALINVENFCETYSGVLKFTLRATNNASKFLVGDYSGPEIHHCAPFDLITRYITIVFATIAMITSITGLAISYLMKNRRLNWVGLKPKVTITVPDGLSGMDGDKWPPREAGPAAQALENNPDEKTPLKSKRDDGNQKAEDDSETLVAMSLPSPKKVVEPVVEISPLENEDLDTESFSSVEEERRPNHQYAVIGEIVKSNIQNGYVMASALRATSNSSIEASLSTVTKSSSDYVDINKKPSMDSMNLGSYVDIAMISPEDSSKIPECIEMSDNSSKKPCINYVDISKRFDATKNQAFNNADKSKRKSHVARSKEPALNNAFKKSVPPLKNGVVSKKHRSKVQFANILDVSKPLHNKSSDYVDAAKLQAPTVKPQINGNASGYVLHNLALNNKTILPRPVQQESSFSIINKDEEGTESGLDEDVYDFMEQLEQRNGINSSSPHSVLFTVK